MENKRSRTAFWIYKHQKIKTMDNLSFKVRILNSLVGKFCKFIPNHFEEQDMASGDGCADLFLFLAFGCGFCFFLLLIMFFGSICCIYSRKMSQSNRSN